MPGAVEIATGAVGALVDAFKDAGFTPPVITYSETESSLKLIVQGSAPTGKHSLSQDFVGDFWRGKLLFSEVESFKQSDSLTVSASLHHQAGTARPHPTDALKGDVCPVAQLTIDASTVKGASDTQGPTTKTATHEASHSDRYISTLSANIHQGTAVNDILAWTCTIEGFHDDHPPRTAMLRPDDSGLHLGLGRVVILLNKHVRALTSLDLVLDYDARLGFQEGDVEFGATFTKPSVHLDLTSAARIALRFEAEEPVNGPGHVGTLVFHLPETSQDNRSYPVICTYVRAEDSDHTALPMGCEDCEIAGGHDKRVAMVSSNKG